MPVREPRAGCLNTCPVPSWDRLPCRAGRAGVCTDGTELPESPATHSAQVPRRALGVVWASSAAPCLRRAPRQYRNTCIPPSFLSAPSPAPSPTRSLFTSTHTQAQPRPGPDQLGRCKHSKPQSHSAHYLHRWPERPAPGSWPTRQKGEHKAGAGGCPAAVSALVLLSGSIFYGSSLRGPGRKAPPVRPWEPRRICLLTASWDMGNGRWPLTHSLAAPPLGCPEGIARCSAETRLAFAYWSVWIHVRGPVPHRGALPPLATVISCLFPRVLFVWRPVTFSQQWLLSQQLRRRTEFGSQVCPYLIMCLGQLSQPQFLHL